MDDERTMIEEQFEDERKPKSNRKKFVFNEKNYFNDKCDVKKGETKKESKIRILPINGTEEYFKDFSNFKAFFVTTIHSVKLKKDANGNGGGFKKFFCLNDPNLSDGHGTCPLCEKSKELFDKANECDIEAQKKSMFKEAGSFKARRSYIVRVIERGHEADGVKFWRFNEHTGGDGIFDLLKGLYNIRNTESLEATGERYNIFDLKNGRDIIVTSTYNPETEKTSIAIADAGFSTPLSKDENQMMEWINDPKTWKDVYSIKSEGYLSIIADGEIPVWNDEDKKWVAKGAEKTEADDGDSPKTEETEEPVEEPDTEVDETEVLGQAPEGDDLPF